MPETIKMAPKSMVISMDVDYSYIEDTTIRNRMSWENYIEFEKLVLLIKDMIYNRQNSELINSVLVFEKRDRLDSMKKHVYTKNEYKKRKKAYEKWKTSIVNQDVTDITEEEKYPFKKTIVPIGKYFKEGKLIDTDMMINQNKSPNFEKVNQAQINFEPKEFCNKNSHLSLIKEFLDHKKMLLKINNDLSENNGSILQALENYYTDRKNKQLEMKLSPYQLEQENVMLSYKDALMNAREGLTKSINIIDKQKKIIRSQKILRISDVNLINNLLSQLCIFYDNDISFKGMSDDVKEELDNMIEKTFNKDDISIYDLDDDSDD